MTPKRPRQLGHFEADWCRAEAVARLKREVNRRNGRFVLLSGATLPLVGVYRDPANEYYICDISGKMCF